MMEHSWLAPYPNLWLAVVVSLGSLAGGCGSTKNRLATEQLVMSDAVDRAVSDIDFRPLSGHKVFLDTKYASGSPGTPTKTFSIVNTDYIISSVRQQLMAADCRLTDTAEVADLIVELRIGTLGTDANDVVYGIPASNALSGAASLVPNAPIVPPIPEISVARREAQHGAAKIAMFAYDRETRRPVWQSGISKARSTVQDTWVLGAGPFQRGTNVDGTQFAGTQLRMPRLRDDGTFDESLPVNYDEEHLFQAPTGISEPSVVNVAGFVNPVLSATPPTPPNPAPPVDAEAKQKEAAAPAPAPAAASKPAAAPAAKPDPAPAPAAPTPSAAGGSAPPAAAPTAEEKPVASPTPAATSPTAGETIRITDQKK